MKQIAARVPEEVDADIEVFSDENGITKSEAIRELLRRGLENDELQSENERLRRQLRETNRRVDEHQELVEYVEQEQSLQQRERERRDAPAWRRAKWWLFGRK